MKFMPVIFALALALGLVFSLGTPTLSVAASSERSGELHVTKECSQYTGTPGSFCTITSSNIPEIKVGARVYYDQAYGTPTGMLDSNVVLHVGAGDWAVGRCTLDSTTPGLCTFSDGVGPLTGFHARIVVTSAGGVNYHWDGPYSFNHDVGKD